MKAMEAIARGAIVSSLALGALGCRRGVPRPRSQSSPDSAITVTAYVAPSAAQQLMPPLLSVAARNGWGLSIRTDSAAVGEVDLVIASQNGRLVARVRSGAHAEAQARRLAAAVGLEAR